MGEGLEKPPRRLPAARLPQMRSRKLSCFWPRIVPVLFTAQNSLSMEGALLFENIAGDTRRKPTTLNRGIERHEQRVESFSQGGMRKDAFF